MKAPSFSLPDQKGITHTLANYNGTWVILYFYPKDDTPGCTKEACNFRDNMNVLKQKDVVVLGISKDTVQSHQKFSDKFSLNFPLLADPTKETIQAYGAWGEKKFMGKTFQGTIRKTFLINPNGDIVKTYEGMKLETHAQDILNDITTV